MAEEVESRTMYVGETVDEKIASSQMFMLGRSIIQRFGQGMTDDEKAFMNVALSQFVITENVERPQRQAPRQQPENAQPQPGRQPAPPRK